jgi:hypothetical protein
LPAVEQYGTVDLLIDLSNRHTWTFLKAKKLYYVGSGILAEVTGTIYIVARETSSIYAKFPVLTTCRGKN